MHLLLDRRGGILSSAAAGATVAHPAVGHSGCSAGCRPRTAHRPAADARLCWHGPRERVRAWNKHSMHGGRHGFPDRRRDRAAHPRRDAAAHHADPDADRLQRRVHPTAAERPAEGGGGAPARHGRHARQEAGPVPTRVLPDRGRHGGGVRGHERHLRRHLRRVPRGGGHAGHGSGAGRLAARPVHHGHAHAFPARRHPHPDLRAPARGGGQGRLEPGSWWTSRRPSRT